ncbi:tyrosine-type recombinase/integrase [Marisediminicola senii]
MATVEAYETAAGKRYRVRYRKPDHNQTTKRGFRTKREAELYLATVELSKAAGTYIDPLHARVTVGELGVTWIASQTHLKPSSIAVVESAWRLHVCPRWGSIPVGEIRHSEVQTWVSQLANGGDKAKPKSPSSVHRAHGVLSSVLEVAVRDRKIPSNPARGVGLPRRSGRVHRYLTHEQVHKLAESTGGHSTLIRVLAYTGLRWGEITALRVQDVDRQARRLKITRNAVLVRGEVIVGSPKTYQQRSVPYPSILDSSLERACRAKGEEDLLFPGPTGGFLVTPTVRQNSWFDAALKMVSLPPMTIHDLRHTAASLAISAGANVKAVQKMLGHASAAMTLDTYADLFDDDLNAVAVRLNEAAISTDVVRMWSEGQIVGDEEAGPGTNSPVFIGK